MRRLWRWFFQATDVIKESLLVLSLALFAFPQARKEAPIPVVVALTSYPPRITSTWRAVETLLRQTLKPQSIVLVLAKEEFPDQQLPLSIRVRQRRGLDILWVDSNGKSYDKLIPVMEKHPHSAIITCDDDKYFPKHLVASLVDAHQTHPEAIIGARGWSMREALTGQGIRYGDNWVRARPGEVGRHLFIPGGNGALYPPGSLSQGVKDLPRALEMCPTADDIWFWAHAAKAKTLSICLGMPPHRPVRLISKSPALSDINHTANQGQFQRIVGELDLESTIQEAVMKANKNPEAPANGIGARHPTGAVE